MLAGSWGIFWWPLTASAREFNNGKSEVWEEFSAEDTCLLALLVGLTKLAGLFTSALFCVADKD